MNKIKKQNQKCLTYLSLFKYSQFGDLSSSLASAGRILHSVDLVVLPISSGSSSAENTGSVVLDRRLDLGVGEEGIIGRVISVVLDGGSESENMLLGEGIIGWN